MSTSATNGTQYAAVGKQQEVNVCEQRFRAILGIVFAALYIGVAGNFYLKVNSFEDQTREDCARTIEHRLSSVCENLSTWNWCAIVGVVLPGFLNLIFASFMFFRFWGKKHQHESEEVAKKSLCNVMWEVNNHIIKFLNIVIFVVLWATKATSTHVAIAQGLETAATIYMCIVGLEMFLIAVLFAIGLFCTVCLFTTGTISGCCVGCHEAYVR